MEYYTQFNRCPTCGPPQSCQPAYQDYARCCHGRCQNQGRCCGCCHCPCVCPPPRPEEISFRLLKLDAAGGSPVRGAGYTLYRAENGRPAAYGVSNACGQLDFTHLLPGEYTLEETMVPGGYLPDLTVHRILVAPNGRVTLDGYPVEQAALYNTPAGGLGFSFLKVDSETRRPLPDATFTLSGGIAATSDADGRVDFGSLAPGTYTMIETGIPDGYLPERTSYNVVVSDDGSVTVNGIPADRFIAQNIPDRAARPVISSVRAGDTIIAGTGIPGATVYVTLPCGTMVATVVNTAGNWAVSVPDGVTLNAGDMIYAYETVPGQSPSLNASIRVQPRS